MPTTSATNAGTRSTTATARRPTILTASHRARPVRCATRVRSRSCRTGFASATRAATPLATGRPRKQPLLRSDAQELGAVTLLVLLTRAARAWVVASHARTRGDGHEV